MAMQGNGETRLTDRQMSRSIKYLESIVKPAAAADTADMQCSTTRQEPPNITPEVPAQFWSGSRYRNWQSGETVMMSDITHATGFSSIYTQISLDILHLPTCIGGRGTENISCKVMGGAKPGLYRSALNDNT